MVAVATQRRDKQKSPAQWQGLRARKAQDTTILACFYRKSSILLYKITACLFIQTTTACRLLTTVYPVYVAVRNHCAIINTWTGVARKPELRKVINMNSETIINDSNWE